MSLSVRCRNTRKFKMAIRVTAIDETIKKTISVHGKELMEKDICIKFYIKSKHGKR